MTVPATIDDKPKQPQAFQMRGKLKAAIEAMVWDGLPRDKAAAKAGMTDHGLYKALRKPPIRAAYLAELDVLRTSERARNIHALVDVRDQTENKMARVAAVKALEQLSDGDSAASSSASHSPGVVIQILTTGPVQARSLPNAGPLISNINEMGDDRT